MTAVPTVTGPDETRIREIVREELGALAAVVLGEGLFPGDGLADRVELLLKGHQAAEETGDSLLQGEDPVLAARGGGLDPADDGLSDGQIVGDGGLERDEFHASPSVGADTPSVGDGPCPEVATPGAGHPQGGIR